LLDVGAGNGAFLRRMRDLGWDVMGHETDPVAAEVVRRAGIPCAEGPLDGAELGASFDAITMHHVIEHVHDPVHTLSTCRRLLEKGGTLWIATPNAESLGYRRFGGNWGGLECPRHLVVFSRRGLEVALRRAGYGDANVALDLGMYGSPATAADLNLRVTRGRRLGKLAVRAENLFGDTVGLVLPALRDELVAVVRATS
jgi:SAM-dependent methyltransferase